MIQTRQIQTRTLRSSWSAGSTVMSSMLPGRTSYVPSRNVSRPPADQIRTRAVRLEVPRASPMPRSTAMYTSAILPSWPTQVLHMDMKTSQMSSAPATILPRGQRRTLRHSRLSALPYTMSSSTLPTPTVAIAMGRVKAVCYDVVFLQRRKTFRKKKLTCSHRLPRQKHYATQLEFSSEGAA